MKFLPLILFLSLAGIRGAESPHPPFPPPTPSPLERFRSWLNMSEAEREKAIAEYPPDKQKVLREKLRSYQSLPADQRNRRLNMLELRWYLRPLMSMLPADRKPHLEAVPVPLQPMVMDRLEAWDRLDAGTRGELLASEERKELVMAYFGQIQRGIPQEKILGEMSQANRARLQEALASWSNTSPENLQRKAEHLATFFDTRTDAQAKALSGLTPAEQTEIQRTLDQFAKLPLEQRRACVYSFQKFARMAPEDRNQFLRNAARWREMTPQERKTWKELVTKLPPMPPLRPATAPMPRAVVNEPDQVATNSAN